MKTSEYLKSIPKSEMFDIVVILSKKVTGQTPVCFKNNKPTFQFFTKKVDRLKFANK